MFLVQGGGGTVDIGIEGGEIRSVRPEGVDRRRIKAKVQEAPGPYSSPKRSGAPRSLVRPLAQRVPCVSACHSPLCAQCRRCCCMRDGFVLFAACDTSLCIQLPHTQERHVQGAGGV